MLVVHFWTCTESLVFTRNYCVEQTLVVPNTRQRYMVRTEWGARGMGRGVARTCPKVAGAEVGAEGTDAGERVEQRPRRGPAVVGEGHVDGRRRCPRTRR